MTSSNASNRPGRTESRPDERRLEHALDALGREPASLSMEVMRVRVERAEQAIHSGSTHSARGWRTMATRKLMNLKTLLAISLLALVAACSVPMEVEEETGRQFVIRTSDSGPVLEDLRSGNWQVGELKVWEQENGETIVLADLLSAGDDAELHFSELPGVLDLQSKALVETVSRSMFGQMLNTMFEVHVNTTGMSDEEINAAINGQLGEQGFPGSVMITRDPDSQHLEVQVDADDLEGLGAEGGQVFIALDEDATVDGDGNATESRMRVRLSDGGFGDINGEMSDEQIRAIVRQQLEADGVNPDDASISITRMPAEDGAKARVEIGVQVESDEPAGN